MIPPVIATANPLTLPSKTNSRTASLRPGSWMPALPSGSALQMLELLPQALLVLQNDGKVLVCNRRAHRMMDNLDIRLVDGRLVALAQLGELQLQQTIHNARLTGGCDCGLWFSGDLSTGWMRIATLPSEMTPATAIPEDAYLAVIQHDQPALTQAARIDALARHSRLSAAERHVLMLLADGMTAELAAKHLALQLSTVRSHVRSLLGKTQAATLMQLLRWTGSAKTLPH